MKLSKKLMRKNLSKIWLSEKNYEIKILARMNKRERKREKVRERERRHK